MDDEEDDDDAVFTFINVFLFHGCAMNLHGVVKAFRIALHLCLVVLCAIIATVKCFPMQQLIVLNLLKEIMLFSCY